MDECKMYVCRTILLVMIMAITPHTRGVASEQAEVPDFRHMRVDNPAALSNTEADDIYRKIAADLLASFEQSPVRITDGYQGWRRYNSAPYLSSTHGNRYVNNYANKAAFGYDTLKKGSRLPAGSVIVKDSFEVTDTGEVLPGRLFVMEKLAPGSSQGTADWRYVMVDSDGSVIADTQSNTANKAEFCHVCHKVRSSRDYLFDVPPDFRN